MKHKSHGSIVTAKVQTSAAFLEKSTYFLFLGDIEELLSKL